MNEPFTRSRGYLPHIESRGSTYFITLRLAGTIPLTILDQIRSEVRSLYVLKGTKKLSDVEEQRLKYLQTKKIQEYLDNGIGECWLRTPAIAEMIKEAVIHHDGSRYISHACCVMPNHLHWILTPERQKGMTKIDSRLIPVMQKFKSFTAHQANKILGRSGSFWSREYYDHRIRTSEEFNRLVQYTIQNPVKARLCSHWQEWPWTFCSTALSEVLAGEK